MNLKIVTNEIVANEMYYVFLSFYNLVENNPDSCIVNCLRQVYSLGQSIQTIVAFVAS